MAQAITGSTMVCIFFDDTLPMHGASVR